MFERKIGETAATIEGNSVSKLAPANWRAMKRPEIRYDLPRVFKFKNTIYAHNYNFQILSYAIK